MRLIEMGNNWSPEFESQTYSEKIEFLENKLREYKELKKRNKNIKRLLEDKLHDVQIEQYLSSDAGKTSEIIHQAFMKKLLGPIEDLNKPLDLPKGFVIKA